MRSASQEAKSPPQSLLYQIPWLHDGICGKHLMPGRTAAMNALHALHTHTPLKNVLELGIGSGSYSIPYYPPDISFVGIDLSRPMLTEAQKNIHTSRAQVALIQMNGECLAFPDNTFDAALMQYFLPAVPDAGRVLKEVHRVIQPGGFAIIVHAFHQRRRIFQFFTRSIPKQTMTRWIGFHAKMQPEEITEAPGWTVIQSEEVEKGRLFVLQKVKKSIEGGAASGI